MVMNIGPLKKKVTITVDNNNTHTIHNLPENNNLKIIKK